MKNRYGIDIWSDDNFFIEDGVVKVNYKPYPSLIKIVKDVRKQGFKGPLLLRFPHITKKQVKTLHTSNQYEQFCTRFDKLPIKIR